MKRRIKALLLVTVLAIICVAFSACSTDPKSLKGEEVNRLEWLEAFEYIANGVSCQDSTISFTSYGTYNQYIVNSSNDNEEKELNYSLTYSLQVNKNIQYAEVTRSAFSYEEAFEENEYLYIDNSGKEQLIYTSTDNEKWKDVSSVYMSFGSLASTVNSLKNGSYKFNKKTGMYETLSYGITKIKFHDKKIVSIIVKTDDVDVECYFTDYGKTEVKKEKPTVEKNKLEIAYNAVKGSGNNYTNVTLSEDCSYMDFKYYGGSNDEDFATINNTLGLPHAAVVATMRETTALNTRKTAKENGIIVTWVKVGENVNNSNGGIYEVTYILE